MVVSGTHLLYPGTSLRKMGQSPVFIGSRVSLCQDMIRSPVLVFAEPRPCPCACESILSYSGYPQPREGSPLITPCAQANHANKRGQRHH